MADMGWARSRGDRAEKEGLRRGAWYRIVEEAGKTWIVLDVHLVEVRVPRENVDTRKDRPKAWRAVHEPHLVCPGLCSPAGAFWRYCPQGRGSRCAISCQP